MGKIIRKSTITDIVQTLQDCNINIKNLIYTQNADIYNALKDKSYLSGDYKPNLRLFTKYAYVYLNPECCDLKTGYIKWPQGEGTLEYDGIVNSLSKTEIIEIYLISI
ncbi:MAG: hypothetical protein IJY25_01000 [Bacilli bacterium]|nr:hypothetical protein [Bacilli bacterium]